MLTAEADGSFERCCKLRTHLDDHILALLKLLLSLLHCLVDHVRHALGINSVYHIADPLLVKVIPAALVRQVA